MTKETESLLRDVAENIFERVYDTATRQQANPYNANELFERLKDAHDIGANKTMSVAGDLYGALAEILTMLEKGNFNSPEMGKADKALARYRELLPPPKAEQPKPKEALKLAAMGVL